MREALDEALGRADRSLEEVSVAEIYGAFAASELLTYEQMGLFEPGEAPAAVARGETSLGGRLPVNTSGGRLSLGHPPQATPLLELEEIYEQLTQRAGERQVANASVGLVQAEHGVMNGTVVAVLET
jgi:acetyl-CoA C-acetyltransferase